VFREECPIREIPIILKAFQYNGRNGMEKLIDLVYDALEETGKI